MRALEDSLKQEQDSHHGTRIELTARQSLLEDRIKQIAKANDRIEEQRQQLEKADEANSQTLEELKKAQLHGEMLAGRVENTRAALDKSRAAERASREKLAELRAEGKRLEKQLNGATRRADTPDDNDRQDKANGSTKVPPGRRQPDLESQIDTLRDELRQSHATSAQYHEQIIKMRNEINRLHRHEALAQANGVGGAIPSLPDREYRDVNGAIRSRMEDLRQRHVTLVDTLKNTHDDSADHRMREELAAIAAAVVGLSGQREGRTSPIHKIISSENAASTPNPQRVSLASRAKSELER
jgi:chromosome segregation ATPase